MRAQENIQETIIMDQAQLVQVLLQNCIYDVFVCGKIDLRKLKYWKWHKRAKNWIMLEKNMKNKINKNVTFHKRNKF